MKYCTQCNKQFNMPGYFCPQCGSKLTEMQNETFCPNCGKKLEAGMKFCDSCGTMINGGQSYGNGGFGQRMQPQKSNRKYILAGIAVLLIVLLSGAGYYFLIRQDNSPSDSVGHSKSLVSEYRNKIIDVLPKPLVNLLGIKKEEFEADNKPEYSNDGSTQQVPVQAQTGNTVTIAPAAPPPAPPPPFPPYNNGNVAGNQNNNGAYIRGTDVRIRTGPGLTYDIMGHFNNGERVTILEVQEGWYKVRRADNSIGFVSSQFCIRN